MAPNKAGDIDEIRESREQELPLERTVENGSTMLHHSSYI